MHGRDSPHGIMSSTTSTIIVQAILVVLAAAAAAVVVVVVVFGYSVHLGLRVNLLHVSRNI